VRLPMTSKRCASAGNFSVAYGESRYLGGASGRRLAAHKFHGLQQRKALRAPPRLRSTGPAARSRG